MNCDHCAAVYRDPSCRLYAGLPDADLCWAREGRLPTGVCDRPSRTGIGLCLTHYRDVVGRRHGTRTELLIPV